MNANIKKGHKNYGKVLAESNLGSALLARRYEYEC